LPDENPASLPEQVVEDKEFQKAMQDLLDSLPAEQRSAMMLYYYEKLSVKQIADVFETSEGTIKSRLNYGRKALKNKLEDYEKKTGNRLYVSSLPLLLMWHKYHDNAPPKGVIEWNLTRT
jgi:DNA-directed RNA polymerase specialized sigma24 family protein